MADRTPALCKTCSSDSDLVVCLQCSAVYCAAHVHEHTVADYHYSLAIERTKVPLCCSLCKLPDVRRLVLCRKTQEEAGIICKKGCSITIGGRLYPDEDANSVFDGQTISDLCFVLRLQSLLGPAEIRLRLGCYEKRCIYTRTFPKPSPKPVKDTVPPPPKPLPRPPPEERKVPVAPIPPTAPVVPVAERSDPESPVPPSSEEEPLMFQIVPDVFEDEDQYLNVFMRILELEVSEERKQMDHIRCECGVKWRKDQKVIGEAILPSVEDLAHGDDLKLSDQTGSSAIVTVHDIDIESCWLTFKGCVDNLFISPLSAEANESPESEYQYTFEFWESGSLKRMKEGLRQFHNGRGVTRQTADWLLGIEKPTLNDTRQTVLKPQGVALNQYQEEAVQYALANELALIQGPPGTGKTVTAAAVVYNMHMKVGEQILVCAPSNIAVDQLTLNIAGFAEVKVLRIYGKSRIKQGGILPAEEHSLHMKVRHYLKKKYPDVGDLFLNKDLPLEKTMITWRIREDISALEQELIDEHNVISCTCAMSTSKKLSGRRFKYLLIDEAGFSAEPETLLPILKGCEHFVLVGDHMQLPPVVKSRVAITCRYGRSMFERLIDIGIEAKMLQLQYRMHPALSAFPSREFYKGRLKDGIAPKDRIMDKMSSFWQAHKPMCFLDISGLEERYGKTHSYCNKEEAELVEHVLYQALQEEIPPTCIGIVTPYEGQRRCLLEHITAIGRCDIATVEIKNIDGFQGREKDIIIISCVRSNSESEVGFLTEARRLNVAITRAKFGLIMVGNGKVLRAAKFWKGLLDEFVRGKCVKNGDALLAEFRRS